MKNFQRNLFILLALALCGTCVWQWNQQAVQLDAIGKLDKDIYEKSAAIQGFTNSIRTMDTEINQMHDRVAELKHTIASNDEWAITEKHQVARLQSDGDIATNELTQYKEAVTNFEAKLKEAYDGEKMLADQRDEFIKKLNDSIKSQNDLTVKYNQLVERFNKLQTNPPAQPTPHN